MGSETKREPLATTLNLRFAERLRVVRRIRGLSLDELAATVGITRTRLLHMEFGRPLPGLSGRTPPQSVSVGHAVALCQALDVGLGVMLGHDDPDLARIRPAVKP